MVQELNAMAKLHMVFDNDEELVKAVLDVVHKYYKDTVVMYLSIKKIHVHANVFTPGKPTFIINVNYLTGDKGIILSNITIEFKGGTK